MRHGSRRSPRWALTQWFGALHRAAATHGGLFDRCDAASRSLLAVPQDIVPLHGDLHHGNVLDFGERGWLAIDPKGLLGERAFDFANIFCNPSLSLALEPGRFKRRLAIITDAACVERKRLLFWVLAWCGLSAAFFLEDQIGVPPYLLRVADLAADELKD